MAHKKAAGSAKNLRNSKPKYRGVKVFGGQTVTNGSIIIRQQGDRYKCGKNTYKGNDFTIHASADGIVAFRKKKVTRYDGRVYLRTFVDVVDWSTPAQEPKAKAKASPKATTTKKAPVAKPVAKKVEAKKENMKTWKNEKKEEVKETKKPIAKKTATWADDLKKIEGIGPKIAWLLTDAGIVTFADLSKATPDAIREILEAAGSRYKMFDPTTRPEQATFATDGKRDELKTRQDELKGGK